MISFARISHQPSNISLSTTYIPANVLSFDKGGFDFGEYERISPKIRWGLKKVKQKPSKPPFTFASLLFIATARKNKLLCSSLALTATLIREASLGAENEIRKRPLRSAVAAVEKGRLCESPRILRNLQRKYYLCGPLSKIYSYERDKSPRDNTCIRL